MPNPPEICVVTESLREWADRVVQQTEERYRFEKATKATVKLGEDIETMLFAKVLAVAEELVLASGLISKKRPRDDNEEVPSAGEDPDGDSPACRKILRDLHNALDCFLVVLDAVSTGDTIPGDTIPEDTVAGLTGQVFDVANEMRHLSNLDWEKRTRDAGNIEQVQVLKAALTEYADTAKAESIFPRGSLAVALRRVLKRIVQKIETYK